MTAPQERLARTLLDILGEEQVIEILGTEHSAKALGVKKLIEMLHTLEPSLGAEELAKLLAQTEGDNPG